MSEQKDTLYYLDSETKNENYRITTFSFWFEDLIKDFSDWLKSLELTFADVKYAVICRADDSEIIADLVSGETGEVVLQPREPDRRLSHRLVLLFRRLRLSRSCEFSTLNALESIRLLRSACSLNISKLSCLKSSGLIPSIGTLSHVIPVFFNKN